MLWVPLVLRRQGQLETNVGVVRPEVLHCSRRLHRLHRSTASEVEWRPRNLPFDASALTLEDGDCLSIAIELSVGR